MHEIGGSASTQLHPDVEQRSRRMRATPAHFTDQKESAGPVAGFDPEIEPRRCVDTPFAGELQSADGDVDSLARNGRAHELRHVDALDHLRKQAIFAAKPRKCPFVLGARAPVRVGAMQLDQVGQHGFPLLLVTAA